VNRTFAAAVLALCGTALLTVPARAQGGGTETPTLYELTAHAPVVIAAQVVSGQVKLAQIKVDEVFRGNVQKGQKLQIAFRDFNLDLGRQTRITFTDGEIDLLFLTPELDYYGKPKGPDRYTLHRGRFGKQPLPREGEEIYRDAMREFAALAAEKDHRKLYGQIRSLVGNPNPLLVEAGLHEILRLDLMDRDLLPGVLSYLNDPSPRRRIQALRLIEELFTDLKPADRSPELEDEALQPVIVVARNDADEETRVRAVDTMAAWGGEEVTRALKAIAELDTAQAVRYQAQVRLLRSDQNNKTSSPGP